MARNNNRPLIIGAGIFGFLALAFTVFSLLGHGGSKPVPVAAPTPTPVPAKEIVATSYIPPRTVITADMLQEKSVAQASLLPNAITDKSTVVGKLSNGPLEAGQLITVDSIIAPIHRVVPANIQIPPGYRAVAVYVDPNQTAAGQVDVGDRVDVIVNHKLHYTTQPNEVVYGAADFIAGRTIAQNLLVLAVDKSLNAPLPTPTPVTTPNAGGLPGAGAPPPPTPTPTPAGAPTPPPTRIKVLLAALPADAEHIVAANETGVIHLTIRSPQDDVVKGIPEAREYPLHVVHLKPTPAPRPSTPIYPKPVMPNPSVPVTSVAPMTPPGHEVTVIRGTEKTRAFVPEGGG